MTDRYTVEEWAKRFPDEASPSTLAWFVAGVLSVERDEPRAPRKFRPFEWSRQLDAALLAASLQGIVVP